MWLHLGGSYWQRASFDAIVVIAATLALIGFAPSWRRFRPHHWITALSLVAAIALVALMLVDSFHYADQLLLRIQVIETSQPALR